PNRGAGMADTPTEGTSDMSGTGGFDFAGAADDMASQAAQYEPQGAMQVLRLMETMPDALTSIANVFKHLAEKADSELPLNPAIAGALGDIHDSLMNAVAGSEELAPLFRAVHEADVARHEDPRNGEEKWDTNNND
ncbi:MAG TPA: hypothetical protein VLH10_08465, partial [Yinghuangia sp.]|nr:hypothetical protein [Yinghuangia sp.]